MSHGKRSLSLVAPVVLALLGLIRLQWHDVQAQGFRLQVEEATIAGTA